jgi:5-methylcytosine-specific restriction protein A
MLEKIYNERKELLKKVDIDISLENLIIYYKWKVSEFQRRVIPSFYWSMNSR